MIFCLARARVGKAFIRAEQFTHDASGKADIELLIADTEGQIEEKYIRYCDVVNPLHYLTDCLPRSAITAMRLRARLPRGTDQALTGAETQEASQLSQDTLQMDLAASANTSLRRYRWYTRSLFLWGSWDSLIFTIMSLQKPGSLSPATTNAAWSTVEELCHTHDKLLESTQALHIAIRRVTLQAWSVNIAHNRVPEPAFITELRSLRAVDRNGRPGRHSSNATPSSRIVGTLNPFPSGETTVSLDKPSGVPGHDVMDDLNLDYVDWTFWDQLIQEHQVQCNLPLRSIFTGKLSLIPYLARDA